MKADSNDLNHQQPFDYAQLSPSLQINHPSTNFPDPIIHPTDDDDNVPLHHHLARRPSPAHPQPTRGSRARARERNAATREPIRAQRQPEPQTRRRNDNRSPGQRLPERMLRALLG
jgi:hypothetical protein